VGRDAEHSCNLLAEESVAHEHACASNHGGHPSE
jgi:hypothetical protein